MKIFQYAKANYGERRRNLYASNGSVSGSTTTRWEDVFGAAQQKTEETKIDSGYFSPKKTETPASTTTTAPRASTPSSPVSTPPVRKDPLSAYSGMNSMNLRIKPKQIEYERYQKFNDVEKSLAEKKEYDAAKVTNPFHHSKTYNMFNNDLKAAFKEAYGDWDGKSEDGKGFAYVDKYGFSHVADNFFSALVYSMDGKVYNYEGKQMGGYAVNAQGHRVALLGLDHSVPYGNFRSGDPAINIAPSAAFAASNMATSEYASIDFVNKEALRLFDFSRVSGLGNIGRLDQ